MFHIKIDTATLGQITVRLFKNDDQISFREFYYAQTADTYEAAYHYAEGLQRGFIVCNRNFTFEGP